MEACGAGCFPVTPNVGGGSEVVLALNSGYTFRNVDDAVFAVRNAIENNTWSAKQISEKAEMFSPEIFRKQLVEKCGI